MKMQLIQKFKNFLANSFCFLDDPTIFLAKLLPLSYESSARINKLRREIVSDIKNNGANQEWIRFKQELCNSVLSKDPRFFLRWEIIKKTMFVDNPDYVQIELSTLQSSQNWNDKWKIAVSEDNFGHPKRLIRYQQSSGNLIHHAYSLMQFEKTTGIVPNSFKVILEFGGGYGSMCRLVQKNGFTGIYIIYDLPEFCALQRYYLSSLGYQILQVDKIDIGQTGILLISDLEELSSVSKKTGIELLIATWSLSETPLKTREDFISKISQPSNFLIAFQENFSNIDNRHYFYMFQKKMDYIEWNFWEPVHLPGNYYLIGKTVKKPD